LSVQVVALSSVGEVPLFGRVVRGLLLRRDGELPVLVQQLTLCGEDVTGADLRLFIEKSE
jgi:hypothetical protein